VVRRAVLDPNVLISARLSPRGTPGQLLTAWTEGQFELVVSPALLVELAGVLDRPKFRRWLSAEEAEAFVNRLRTGATLIDDPPLVTPSTPDPDDDYLVALAQKADADCLVSGDGDLTGLAEPKPPVFTPRAFFESLDDAT
jgi:putative PIN family toxin of toxin-antitoxin system